MKKSLKIILGIIVGIVLCFVIDLIFIFTFNRPLFAVRENNGNKYIGIVMIHIIVMNFQCHK